MSGGILIGITGKKGTGKNTLGTMLARRLTLRLDSFAAPIKTAAMEWFDLSLRQVDGTIAEKETPDPRWDGITPRQILQRLGTEVARSIHPDVWARALIRRHQTAMVQQHIADNPVNGTVVTDVRFPNEARILHEAGGFLVHIANPRVQDNEFSAHASEVEVESLSQIADYTVRNDATLWDLEAGRAYVIADDILARGGRRG